jgi:hypothetical protein
MTGGNRICLNCNDPNANLIVTCSAQAIIVSFIFVGAYSVVLNYHSFQICLQPQLKCFLLLYLESVIIIRTASVV